MAAMTSQIYLKNLKMENNFILEKISVFTNV